MLFHNFTTVKLKSTPTMEICLKKVSPFVSKTLSKVTMNTIIYNTTKISGFIKQLQ